MRLTVELKPSKIGGIGLFVVKSFEKDDPIFPYIKSEDYERFKTWKSVEDLDESIMDKIYDFCILEPDGFVPHYNFDELITYDYINHSCKPNTFVNKNGYLTAKYGIKYGTELTVDYGTINSDPEWKMKCSCGSRGCRQIITGTDFWKLPIDTLIPQLRKVRELNGQY